MDTTRETRMTAEEPTSSRRKIAALLAAGSMVCVAVLHAYWGIGGFWPGRDAESLAEKVVGDSAFPPPAACWLVAVLLLTAASAVLGATGIVRVSLRSPWLQRASLAIGLVFALRGVSGFFWDHLRPASAAMPFHRLNLWIYSPLCLVLAGLSLVAAWPRGPSMGVRGRPR